MLKKPIRTVLFIIIALCVCFNADTPAYSSASLPVEITAPSAVLIDAGSGAVIYQKDMDARYFPASITKIMTALLAIENSGDDYLQRVYFSRNAVFSIPYDSSHIAMDEGESLTLNDALLGLMLESANEVANALSEHFAADTADFALLMTARAKELGAVNTNFTNPHGLHDENHYTTAADMAIITKEAIKHPKFIELISTTAAKIPPTERQPMERNLNNSHKMIHSWHQSYYEYAVGGKTGFTNEAGNTLVTYAKKDGMELIAVVLNDESNIKAYEDTRALFDYGFGMFKNIKIFDAETFTEHISIIEAKEGGSVDTGLIDVYAKEDVTLLLPANIDLDNIRQELNMPYQMAPPVEKDENVGSLNLYYMDNLLGTVELFSATQATAATLEQAITKAAESAQEKSFPSPLKIALMTFAAVSVMGVLFIVYERGRRRRRRELARINKRRAMRRNQNYPAHESDRYRYRD